MLELIERLEELEAPNFAIEQEIGRWRNPQATSHTLFPAYTGSIDAAMTLVPEGWAVRNTMQRRSYEYHWISLRCDRGTGEGIGKHNSFAIALCIAALKARNATGTGKTEKIETGKEHQSYAR